MPRLRYVPTPEQQRTIVKEIVNVRPRCEKEMGSHKIGWHACGKPAKVFSDRELNGGSRYRLYFCETHRVSAEWTDLPHDVRIVQVGEVTVE